MENNNLKLNKSEIARQLNVDRRTVDKYLNGFNKSKHRSKPSNPVIRYETGCGEQAQLDWKESIPFVLADTGEIITIHVLVLILG